MNFNTLTLGELAQLEDLAGASLSSFGDEAAPKAKLMAALVYVIKRREDKDYTLVKAQSLTLEETTAIIEALTPSETEGK